MDAFQFTGLWYLPNNPDEKIVGTLRYSPDDGLLLSLTGSLSEPFGGAGVKSFPLIHGVLVESPYGRCVSLINSFPTRISLSIPGFATQDIVSSYAYIANGMIDESCQKLSKIQLYLNRLREWVDVTGIQRPLGADTGMEETHEVTLSYKLPEPILLSNRNVRVAIEFEASMSETRSRTVSLKEKVFITVDGIKDLGIHESNQAYAYPIRNLFTLITTCPSVIEEHVVYSENFKLDNSDILLPIYVVYKPSYKVHSGDRLLHPDEMLFSFSDIRDRLAVLFDSWMGFSEQYRTFCDVYFALQDAPPHYLETKFSLLMLAYDLFFEKNY